MLPTVRDRHIEPILDLIRLLKPRNTLSGGFDARGKWALSFRQRNDVLFCWVESGECQLIRQGSSPVRLTQGDFALVRTDVPFVLTSDPSAQLTDSEAAVAAVKGSRLQLGTGHTPPVVLHAGKFVFGTTDQNCLIGFLPSIVHIGKDNQSAELSQSLLAMNSAEKKSQRPGQAFATERLVELLLLEILRASTPKGSQSPGLLAGLSDRVTMRALTAMHEDISHSWTVAKLAHYCAVSRSTLAARFSAVLGISPMAYLHRIRMELAKEALRSRSRSITEVGFSVGFKSQSAFTTAFTREVGCPPTHFAATAATTGANISASATLNHVTPAAASL